MILVGPKIDQVRNSDTIAYQCSLIM